MKKHMAAQMESSPRKLEIKKYPNRRYYDATHSRHLTLDEIRSLIQQGYDISVSDGKTGDDITAQLLTQIILELETAKLESFPVPLLLRLIRMNDQMVKDFIEKYFNQALKSFLDYEKQLEDHMRRAHGLPASLPSISAWTEALIKPFAAAFGSEVGNQPAEPSPSSAASEESQDLREMIHNLQQQVTELKRRRHKTKSPRRKRKR
jgi:polyhydroxyalkanoate synthesis repressor PhaR